MEMAVLEVRRGGTLLFDARSALNVGKMHQFKIARLVFHQKSVLYIDEGLPRLRYGRVPGIPRCHPRLDRRSPLTFEDSYEL